MISELSTPLSDLVTFLAANIWGKIFLSRRLYISLLNINIIPNNDSRIIFEKSVESIIVPSLSRCHDETLLM